MTSVLESLNSALAQALEMNENVILLGEDIKDPYGGAFKVTRSLSDRFPGRVINTPISEAGMVGIATGLALRGLIPVAEIMFGDFSTLVVDQVVNHLSKICSMYRNIDRLPMVIRSPMGGRRGYGPTHSQSLERLFLGVPNIKVIAPANYEGGAGELLLNSILSQDEPIIFIENKLQYLLKILHPVEEIEVSIESMGGNYPCYLMSINGAPEPQCTIITYGYSAELARQAMIKMAYEQELFVNILVFTQLSPLDLTNYISVFSDRQILILEEGISSWGWGAEVAAWIGETMPGHLRRIKRLGTSSGIIPASMELERQVLPQVEDIMRAIHGMQGAE